MLNGRDDGGVVVIGEHHVGRLFRDVSAGDTHGHADVGPFEGRGIVDAVTGHSHHVTPRFERFDDAHLVLGGDTGENIHVLYALSQLLVGEVIQFRTGERFAVGPQQTDFLRNGAGSIGIVTGDHHRADARPPRPLHRWPDFRPGRIRHRHQPNQCQATFNRIGADLGWQFIQVTTGHGQDAQSRAPQLTVDILDVLAAARREWHAHAILQDNIAEGQHHVGCTFDVGDVFGAAALTPPGAGGRAVYAVDGAHTLAFAVEGHLGHARQSLFDLVAPQAGFGRYHHQCPFRRITHHAVLLSIGLGFGRFQLGVGAKQASGQQGHDFSVIVRVGRLAVAVELARGLIALAAHVQSQVRHVEPHGHHLVLGQRTGLVGADDSGRAQRLHRRQASDEGIALHHLAHPQRQADGDDSGQPLRDSSNRQADRDDEKFHNLLLGLHQVGHQSLAGEDGEIGALDERLNEDDATDSQRTPAQPLAQLIETTL